MGLAIAVHLVLGVVAWRVAVRVGLLGDRNPARGSVEEGKGRSLIPVIMPVVEGINAGSGRVSMVAYGEGEEAVEWRSTPHDRVGVDWAGEDAPLVGCPRFSDEVRPRLKGKGR